MVLEKDDARGLDSGHGLKIESTGFDSGFLTVHFKTILHYSAVSGFIATQRISIQLSWFLPQMRNKICKVLK